MKRTAPKVPNAHTREAMAEIDEMVKTGRARFGSADEMFAELEEAGGQRPVSPRETAPEATPR